MNETDFLKVIEAEPANPVPRLVYADWLDEQGDPRGELLRIQEELRRIQVPDRAIKEVRMHELLKDGVEPLMITHTTSIGMKMVLIFPGEFVMGSPETEEDRNDDEDQVAVRLTQGFWLGRHAVTQSEWRQVMGNQPWKGKDYVQENPVCPATFIGWEDVIVFCRRLTEQELRAGRLQQGWEYTLPTEAKWEYTCRAGTTSHYSFGENDSDLDHYAWFSENAWDKGELYAHPIAQKMPNSWGLFDMHGNVWEWCRDWAADKLPGGHDPEVTVEGSYRVYRGGSWRLSSGICRSAFRGLVRAFVPEQLSGFPHRPRFVQVSGGRSEDRNNAGTEPATSYPAGGGAAVQVSPSTSFKFRRTTDTRGTAHGSGHQGL